MMTTYLIQYNRIGAGPLSVPISEYSIPPFWSEDTILEMGKQYASGLPTDVQIFAPDYDPPSGSNIDPREAVIEEYIDNLSLAEVFQQVQIEESLAADSNDPHMKDELGTIANTGLQSLHYFRKYTKYVDNQGNGTTYYNLNSGLWVAESNTALMERYNDVLDQSQNPHDNGKYYYVYSPEDGSKGRFYRLNLPAQGIGATSEHVLVENFWNLLGGVVRYATPLEDVIILFTGEDFDGIEQSRLEAGLWLVVDFVPGSKAVSPVLKLAGNSKVVGKIFKWGDEVVIRIIEPISTAIRNKINSAITYTARQYLDEAIKNGDFYREVIEEAADEIVDFAERNGRPANWSEVLAFFKRGNDFNKKAVESRWYRYNEVHLGNGKRLDSYDPVKGEIISRKATDLDKIKFSTFEGYLKELQSKYSPGTTIKSQKYYKTFKDHSVLKGQQYLEIPSTNQNFKDIEIYKKFAWDNYKIEIRFRPE